MEENRAVTTAELQWVKKAPMAMGISEFGAEALNGKIYVFGGKQNTIYLKTVETYDSKTDSWKSNTNMPTTRQQFDTAVLNNKIYVMGGWVNGECSNSVEVYNPETNSWKNGTPLPVGRMNFKAVSMGEKLYVIGGVNKDTGITDAMEIYDPKTDAWTTGASLPFKMQGFAAAALNGKIYIIGGSGNNKNNEKLSGFEVFMYDEKTNRWENGPSIPEVYTGRVAAVVGNNIYVLGGDYYGTSKKDVYILDTINYTWSQGLNMLYSRSGHNAVVIDQTLYTMGHGREMESLELTKDITQNKLAVFLNPEESVQLSVSNDLADNEALTWTSSSEAVATVDANGKASAVAPGLSDITATNADESFKEFIPVRVLPGTADLYRLAVHLTPGESKQLGMTKDLEGITWKSMDEYVVTVDTNGKITAVANGLAIIEATVGSDVQHIYVRVKAEVILGTDSLNY